MTRRTATLLALLLALCAESDALAQPAAPAKDTPSSSTDAQAPPKKVPRIEIPSVPVVSDASFQNILLFCQAATHIADVQPPTPPSPAADPALGAHGAAAPPPGRANTNQRVADQKGNPRPPPSSPPGGAPPDGAQAKVVPDAPKPPPNPRAFAAAAVELEDSSKGVPGTKKTPAEAAKDVFTTADGVHSGCERLSGSLKEADLAFLREIAKQDPSSLAAVTRADSVLTKVGRVSDDAQLRREFSTAPNVEVFTPVSQASFLGGAESQIVNGLADFVVTRAKAEAAKYLQDEIFGALCKDDKVKPYIPNLCQAVHQLDPSMTLSGAGAYLKAAAMQDLERVPETALELGDADKHDDRSAVLLALVLIRTIADGRMPLDALWSTKAMICPNVMGESGAEFSLPVRQAACVSSQILYGIVSQMGWTDTSRGQSTRYLAFAALLSYEKQRGTSLDVTTFNDDVPAVLAAVPLASALNSAQRDAKSASDPDARQRARMDLVASGLGLAMSAANVRSSSPAAPGDAPLAAAAKSIQFGNKSATHDLAAMTIAGQGLVGDLGIVLPDGLTKVIAFVVEVGSAGSSKDVASAIDASVAPVGSYKAKYQRGVIAINAFVGAGGGKEWIQQSGDWKGSADFGGFAPVGLHATTPLVKDLFHVGAFLGVVDLGALVSTRIDSETSPDGMSRVGKEPTLGLAQVFAPGLYGTLGLFGSPLVLGIGGEVSPSLRHEVTVDSTGKQVASNDLTALRGQAFLALDLTLLPF
jgi:hypothetical protein